MLRRGYGCVLLGLLALLVHAEDVPETIPPDASVMPEETLVVALKAFEGRWLGHFTVHSTATGYTETFTVEQQYWWKNGKLHGVAVTEREQGMSSSRSQSIVEGGKYLSEVRSGDSAEMYWGVLRDGGVVWFSSNLKRLNDYQMKETIMEVDGKRVLKTEGFDTYVYGEGMAHLVYRGELKFVE
ncbi:MULTISPECIES: hypothetical protein [unclassified Lentimonas]|uniref:hypothetical protein n=1 Tax=unclassified Lentimonas TaxID=2630993 RepID=UPI001321B324|nr:MULTISPECIES: hypothetical protein [unclassified Lentimonas]CAA6676566.1 Unannotated [Lentimonas sp. CC4]CAA6684770.1 Unannotated [Lentimonas sp. CC6]CAA7075406.1 Unannotated [Lentimonas sp. CC4]CAA7168931.1 Unannotated [Lentimonas sp. CC21]CAA7182185.1 Unannotated [Lentimonas sp. CC8]